MVGNMFDNVYFFDFDCNNQYATLIVLSTGLPGVTRLIRHFGHMGVIWGQTNNNPQRRLKISLQAGANPKLDPHQVTILIEAISLMRWCELKLVLS